MGIPSYSTTASENDSATGITWAEGQAPSTVNNSARQMLADTRTQWNDAEWFEYRDGTPDGAASYVANNQFKITGNDATTYWHVGRRVKVVDVSPLTTYATITATSFGAGATTVTIDSTALTNVALTPYGGIMPAVNSALPLDQTFDTITISTGIEIGGTGAANTLTDYEEGTFTPTIQDNTGSDAEGQTYSAQVGQYTKIGRLVNFYIRLITTSLGTLTTSDAVTIAGLPFTVASGFNPALATAGGAGLSIGAGISVTANAASATTKINVLKWSSTAGTSNLLLSEWTADGKLTLSGAYTV